ncbi:hypothetical protein SASPL_137413 [Salvia splendens]|uniref:Uncharacterized protein n=1 Tax=Salvia splendens TaxID=180675 RepID=A0A8X8ZDF7_SALSN|nr:hypothetical protein SASPL_137413 [Salvia splendens]
MSWRVCSRLPLLFTAAKPRFHTPLSAGRLLCLSDASLVRFLGLYHPMFQVSRSYRRPSYDLFGGKVPKAAEFRKEWAKKMEDDEDHLWTGSEDESDNERDDHIQLKKEIKKAKQRAKERSDRIDADDSDELRSIWSESDEEKSLWTGDEGDDEDDALKEEEEPEELSPGKLARKQAVQNALKKLKKGPDGRYTNVWEVMSDLDILVGAFENIISGPEYEELRQGGPKKLNMEFFKDIQAKMRDPNYKFSPELKLKPKSKLVSRKKWMKTESRRRRARRR